MIYSHVYEYVFLTGQKTPFPSRIFLKSGKRPRSQPEAECFPPASVQIMLLLEIPNKHPQWAGQHGLQASRRPSVFIWPVSVLIWPAKTLGQFRISYSNCLKSGKRPRSQPEAECFFGRSLEVIFWSARKTVQCAHHIHSIVYTASYTQHHTHSIIYTAS